MMLSPTTLDQYRGAKAVVLGASGFIGRWVARALCQYGAHAHLVVRNEATAKAIFTAHGAHGDVFKLDLQSPEAIIQWCRRIKPSVVFNLAGYGVDPLEREANEAQQAYQMNVGLVQAICQAMADYADPQWRGQDIVHVGTLAELGPIHGNIDENTPPRPTTLYGRTKLAGTDYLAHYCRTHNVRGVIARLSNVYGPGEHRGRLLPSLFETASMQQPLPLTSGKQKRDFIYVEDVAEGLLRLGLAPAAPGALVHLASGQLTSVRSFVATAARILRIPIDKLQFGAIPMQSEALHYSAISLEKLYQLLAWTPPTGIADGIRRTLDFDTTLRQSGYHSP